MGQVNHLVRIQPSVLASLRKSDVDDFFVLPEMKDIGHADAVRERFAYEMSRPAIYRSSWDGKSVLLSRYGREVWSSFGELKTEETLRQSQDELHQLSVQLLTIQEDERQRIAADLHDGIGQSLSLVKLSVESVEQLMNAGKHKEAVESLQQVIHKVKDAMDELRRTTMDLHPSMLDDLGLIPTLSWFFREFEMAWRDRKIEKDVSVAESDVPAPLKAAIFRILQEAMHNIVKHANADLVQVSLKKSGSLLQLSIEDNGHGFDPTCVSLRRGSSGGLGLTTMRERARYSGGAFEIKSTLEHGTQILISWRIMDSAVDHGAAGLLHSRDS